LSWDSARGGRAQPAPLLRSILAAGGLRALPRGGATRGAQRGGGGECCRRQFSFTVARVLVNQTKAF